MKFLHHLFSSNKQTGFDNIQGYDDVKNILRRALASEDNYNLLFTGPPASAKTLFLLGILESRGSTLMAQTPLTEYWMS
jgi:predicted ATPase with chaperone activity